jgi:tetratricopeptide (TPR) repeat protein
MLAIGRGLGNKQILAIALNRLGYAARSASDFAASRSLLEEGLAMAREAGDRGEIAFSLQILARITAQDAPDTERRLLEEALAIRRELGDTFGIASSLFSLGVTAGREGDSRAWRDYCTESLGIWRQLRNHHQITWMLRCLGMIAYADGDYEAARSFYEEGLAIWQELGVDSQVAFWRYNLGAVALARGDLGEARALFEASGARLRELADWQNIELGMKVGITACLAGLSGVAGLEGQHERAARLLGAAQTLRAVFDLLQLPVQRSEIDRILEVAGAQIDEQVWAAALAEGQAMTPERALTYALEGTAPNE